MLLFVLLHFLFCAEDAVYIGTHGLEFFVIILEIMVSIVLGVLLNRKLLFFCSKVFHGRKLPISASSFIRAAFKICAVIFPPLMHSEIIFSLTSSCTVPQRLLRFFADIAPQMDASLIMLCDPDIIYARKQELSKDEIIRQIGMYRELAESRKTFFVFDSSKDVMENVREARKTVGI